jgi:3-hydroxy acid dehydrogenase/malonic semialdehyde reductase
VEVGVTALKDRLVFITGASSGIGMSCARAFAAAGARLLLAARRVDRLEALAAELEAGHGVACRVFELDVRRRAAVEAAVAGLPAEWAEIDVLVNNAGLSRGLDKIHEGLVDDWDEMVDTNVKGLLYITRAVLPGMVRRGRGHVINIGSIAGHEVYPGGAVYCATKYGVNAISRAMRLDLSGTGVRVTSVDPGLVETEFSRVRFHGDEARAAKVYQGFEPLEPDDVAEAVVWCASRPARVNVSELIVMPTAQASTTLVSRKP